MYFFCNNSYLKDKNTYKEDELSNQLNNNEICNKSYQNMNQPFFKVTIITRKNKQSYQLTHGFSIFLVFNIAHSL